MNKERIKTIGQSEFFKSIRKERMMRAFLQSILPLIFFGIALGLLFWPLFIPFTVLAIAFALKEAVNLRCSLLALAELSDEDFSELVRLSGEGRLEPAVVGSYSKDGLLLRSAYIPYNSIVRMKYRSSKYLPAFITELLIGIHWKDISPCVIIYRKVHAFGMSFTLGSKHRMHKNVNYAPALEKFTDEILARSENTILIDNDYVFENI